MTVDSSLICGSLNSRLAALVEGKIDRFCAEIKPVVDQVDYQLAEIGDAATASASDIDDTIDQKTKDVEETLAATSDSDSITPDAKTILECLGGSIKPHIDVSSIANSVDHMLDDAVSDLVSSAQRAVAGTIEKIVKKIPTEDIDKVMQLAQCLANCPGGASYTVLDIENKLSDAGIKASGDLDMDALSGSPQVKSATKTLGDAKKSAKERLSKKLVTG